MYHTSSRNSSRKSNWSFKRAGPLVQEARNHILTTLGPDHPAAAEADGVLRLRHDPTAIEQAVARHDQWWRDLTAGLWWAWYDPQD